MKSGITLEFTQKQHPTAKVVQLNPYELFIIEYPGIKLAISYKYLIAFEVEGEWHMSTQGSKAKGTMLHKRHIHAMFNPTRWYDTNRDLKIYLQNYLSKHKTGVQ